MSASRHSLRAHDLAWWAADAVESYGRWLQRQPLSDQQVMERYRTAVAMQAQHKAGELAALLRSTGDPACLACAVRYEAVKAEL